MPELTVSICITVMNRLHHIRETLPTNLDENNSPGIEFILLDYNSTDGLDHFIKDNFQKHLQSGRLIYYKCNTEQSFKRSHSRNMAFRLANGDIVCNLDGDNYAGEDFGKYVQEVFSSNENICLTGLQNRWLPDASGKLCVKKSDFIDVTGYDENFEGYGFEDFDMVNRLLLSGCKPYTMNKKPFLKGIRHTNSDRLIHDRYWQMLEDVYVHFIDANTSKLLYLFKDGKWSSATVVNNYTLHSDSQDYSFVMKALETPQFTAKGDWDNGRWALENDSLVLFHQTKMELCNQSHLEGQKILESKDHLYYHVAENSLKLDAVSFYTQAANIFLIENNLEKKNIRVNKVFGNGTVYKNFEEDKPIEIRN